MISDRFLLPRARYIVLGLMLIFLTASGYLLALTYYAASVVLFIGALIMTGMELKIYSHTHDAITFFFDSLRNEDTSLQFPAIRNNASLSRLYEGMNKLNRHFQDIRLQNEYNEKYYQALIRNSATGLVVLNRENNLELMNELACRYAGISPDSSNPNILKVKNPPFYDALCRLQPGVDQTYRQEIGNSVQWLLFKAILFQKNDASVRLISIQDIRQELESREIESYRKLISVLTHEIMNLLSPLNSVAGSLNAAYHPGHQPITLQAMNEEILKTTLGSIEVINEQSTGLMNFVHNYRKLSKIPAPDIRAFETDEWLDQLRIVYAEKMSQQGIDFSIHADKNIKQIVADKKLINQVLINLMNNAMDAVNENEKEKMIRLSIEISRFNRLWISLSNNGPAIQPEIQDKIFVPFYTTKKEGSGIGLSICQEIMRLHHGSIMLLSGGQNQTTFILEL